MRPLLWVLFVRICGLLRCSIVLPCMEIVIAVGRLCIWGYDVSVQPLVLVLICCAAWWEPTMGASQVYSFCLQRCFEERAN